jgi:hypothetical protein
MKFGQWWSISVKKGNFDLSQLRQLDMDETALRKGQEEYIVMLIDLDKHE